MAYLDFANFWFVSSITKGTLKFVSFTIPSRDRRLKENAKKVAKENSSLTAYFSTS
jgi:hypothetical protein